ncbi:hypothetical protein EFL95_10740 [Nocardioides marmorisolisilvae]|uniref:Uncharacterized protein n=2 Tax=Nocardioides marmorisolisilvae TaxID=1542737 RepID=A0A3N0DV09_9ACTN|nr:hypothetical protein EFL95_10740 [Nocardioides marmorisolisilvae]
MGQAVTVGSILSLGVPKGWTAVPSEVVLNGTTGSVCLNQPTKSGAINPDRSLGCSIEIYFGSRLPGAENSEYAPNQGEGWYHGTDVAQCPFVPQEGKLVPMKMADGFDKGLKPVGAHQAAWNRWTASCAGHTFHPQAWFLPKSKVLIFDYIGHSQTASVLASAKFAADGVALPTYVSGHLVSVSGSKVLIQPFHTYTTGAAGKAYAKAHGIAYPFPNDYYDADQGAKRTIVVDSSTKCVGNVELGKDAGGAAMSCSAFLAGAAKHKGMPMAFWVLPGSSTAQTAIEIFRP